MIQRLSFLLFVALVAAPARAVEKTLVPPGGLALPTLQEGAIPGVVGPNRIEAVMGAGPEGAAAANVAAMPELQSMGGVGAETPESAARNEPSPADAASAFDGQRLSRGCAHCHHQHDDDPEHLGDAPVVNFVAPAKFKGLLPSDRFRNPQDWTGETTLHLHSVFSDGTMEPEAVIQLAYDKGVRDVALSDHDSLAGVMRAWKKAKELGMTFHPAIEMTARNGVHVGAVDLDVSNPRLLALLERVRQKRLEHAKVMISKLNDMPEVQAAGGIKIEEVIAKSKHDEGGTIELPHLARVLLEKGLIEHVDDAFDKYLKGDVLQNPNGTPDPTVDEVLEIIRDAGGKAFLNHPYTVRVKNPQATDDEKDQAILEVLDKGFDGIEVYRPIHAKGKPGWARADERAAKYLGWAQERGLLAGNGADFHGTDTHLNEVLVWMPKTLAAKLEDGLKDANAKALAILESLTPTFAAPKAPATTVLSVAAVPVLALATTGADLPGTIVACLVAAVVGGLISVWMNRGQ